MMTEKPWQIKTKRCVEGNGAEYFRNLPGYFLFRARSVDAAPDLARSIGVQEKFHRAEADAYAVGQLLLYLMEKDVAIDPWK